MIENSNDLSRRNLLLMAGATATACACCMVTPETARADDGPPPRHHDDDERSKGPAATSLPIGKLADYEKPGFSDKFRAQKVMVSKLDDRLVVMSALCTHKGCVVKVEANDPTALQCPCHKAEFSDQGTVTKGPARSSLVRYAVSAAADGTITADLTKSFEEQQWEDPASFIAIKK